MSRVIRLVQTAVEREETPMPSQEATESAAEDLNLEHLRMTEALLFAASEPLDNKALSTSLPDGAALDAILTELQKRYEGRGVNLVRVADKWQFRTAPDLAFLLRKEQP
ncbi:MAG TPA: SMC-Scp complex subunit ScpB, partial [Rhizomicrobium sp.]|nr:SMC-Scp complex subunit ScpB [Rhizomicrobium sp.]